MNKTLVLFDFDGTITHKNSFLHFVEFIYNKTRVNIGLLKLLPNFTMLKLKLKNNEQAFDSLIYTFLNNFSKEELEKYGKEFYHSNFLNEIIKKSAMKTIINHQKLKHEVIIVSASSDVWLNEWCVENNLKLISNKLKFNQNNIYNGGFSTKYCWGIEKVNRIKKEINLSKYNSIYAYGDSRGDKEMLELASKNNSYYKYFD